MYLNLFLVCLLVHGITCMQGSIQISNSFWNGSLKFTWKSATYQTFDYFITRDTKHSSYIRSNNNSYIVTDILQYRKLAITFFDSETRTNTNHTYDVSKAGCALGNSVNLSFNIGKTISFYTIYHIRWLKNEVLREPIVSVWPNKHEIIDLSKNFKLIRTDNTNSTTLMIMDVADEDAGFYGWGNDSAEALSRPGVVVIVHKKPSMPSIEGTLSVEVGSTTQLTCSSKSTSVPDYYSKLNILEFSWFINDTELFRETSETLIVNVTKKARYDRFTCTASDMIESKHSSGVHVDPLYGPAEVIFVPQPNKMKGKLFMSIKEGDNFGPSQCLADCNPPCNMTWRYKDSTGFVDVASNGGQLLSQKVKRDMVFFCCVAEGRIGRAAKGSIFLDVIYMEFPILDVYKENEIKLQTTDVKEGTVLQLSCFVEGNPIPEVQISKVHKNRDIVLLESNAHWSNYSFKREVTCLDSGIYACSGRIEELQSKRNKIFLNILCDPRYQQGDRVEVFDGAMIGLEKAVIVKIPVTSNPPPLISNVSWIGPDDQMINDTSVLSRRDNDNPYIHMIISIVPISESWQYGEYHVSYNSYCLINITIDEKDVTMLQSMIKRNRNSWLYITGLLISTILLAVLGTVFLGVIIYLLHPRRQLANRKNDENPIETEVYEIPQHETYNNVNSIENHTYSEIGTKLEEQNI